MANIIQKTSQELAIMRRSGEILSETLAAMRDAVAPGVSTYDLDQLGLRMVRERGGAPSFLGYKGYPASACISLNAEVVHGIPTRERVLRAGDLVKIDFGCRYKGYHADSALTVPVGEIAPEKQRLLDVTREALWRGIKAARYRGHLQEISQAIQTYVESNGFSVVREMVGHGIGSRLHEDPQVPNYVDPVHPNPVLLEGMTIAIEPMVNLGGPEIRSLADGWTVVAADGLASAHFEHTIAITRGGVEILTLGPHLPAP